MATRVRSAELLAPTTHFRRHAATLGGDRPWLVVMAALVTFEAAWWTVSWNAAIAPAPLLLTYAALSSGVLLLALVVRFAVRPGAGWASWPSILVGTAMVCLGASLFLPLKYAIPGTVPFWLDVPLAAGERALLGTDPWLLLDRLFGWAAAPIDLVYGLWLPTQSLVLFLVIIAPPSPAKSRALIAYSLAWFLLGVVAAAIFSSAGPLFYDRLYGGVEFAGLGETLRDRGAWVALAESDQMWAALDSGHPGLIAGISAMPSLHVAVSLWIYLTARTLAPRFAPLALAYVAFMWVASVQLGWHYVSDGLAGLVGMAAIWAAVEWVVERPAARRQRSLDDDVRPWAAVKEIDPAIAD